MEFSQRSPSLNVDDRLIQCRFSAGTSRPRAGTHLGPRSGGEVSRCRLQTRTIPRCILPCRNHRAHRLGEQESPACKRPPLRRRLQVSRTRCTRGAHQGGSGRDLCDRAALRVPPDSGCDFGTSAAALSKSCVPQPLDVDCPVLWPDHRIVVLDPINGQVRLKALGFSESGRSSIGIAGYSGACGQGSPGRGETGAKLHGTSVRGDALGISPSHEMAEPGGGLIQRLMGVPRAQPHPGRQVPKAFVARTPESVAAPSTTCARAKFGFSQSASSNSSMAGLEFRDSM